MTMEGDDFRGTLNQQYDRAFRLNGEWEVALTHLRIRTMTAPLFVFCNLVDYSYVNNSRMQLLDFANGHEIRNYTPRYVKVVKKRFSTINVSIKKHPDDADDLDSSAEVICVLHFRKA